MSHSRTPEEKQDIWQLQIEALYLQLCAMARQHGHPDMLLRVKELKGASPIVIAQAHQTLLALNGKT